MGPHLGPTGPRRAPCWPHDPCYLGSSPIFVCSIYKLSSSKVVIMTTSNVASNNITDIMFWVLMIILDYTVEQGCVNAAKILWWDNMIINLINICSSMFPARWTNIENRIPCWHRQEGVNGIDPVIFNTFGFWNLGTTFSEILIKTQPFSYKKIHFKILSAKWLPFCLGLNVLPYVMMPNKHINF